MLQTIKLVAEHAIVEKRTVVTGVVRVSTRVIETQEQVQPLLHRDVVEIERVAIGRVVEHASLPRDENGVTIVPVYEERLVVTRQLILKEEVRIKRRTASIPSPAESVTLRHEVLEVTRHPPITPPAAQAAIQPKET